MEGSAGTGQGPANTPTERSNGSRPNGRVMTLRAPQWQRRIGTLAGPQPPLAGSTCGSHTTRTHHEEICRLNLGDSMTDKDDEELYRCHEEICSLNLSDRVTDKDDVELCRCHIARTRENVYQ